MLESRQPEAAMIVEPSAWPASFTPGFSEYTSSIAPTSTMTSRPTMTPRWLMPRLSPVM